MKLKNLFRNALIISCLLIIANVYSKEVPPSGVRGLVARKIKLGFIPLTDCAPLVAAKELGLFAKYGGNGLSLEKILIAILIIGTVGLILDMGFNALQKYFSWEKK